MHGHFLFIFLGSDLVASQTHHQNSGIQYRQATNVKFDSKGNQFFLGMNSPELLSSSERVALYSLPGSPQFRYTTMKSTGNRITLSTHNKDDWTHFMQALLNIELAPTLITSTPFSAEGSLYDLGTIKLARYRMTEHVFVASEINGKTSGHSKDYLTIHLQLSGLSTLTLGNINHYLAPGKFTINIGSDKAFSVSSPQGNEQVILLVPWYDLYPYAPNIRRLQNFVIDTDTGIRKLFSAHLLAIYKDVENITTPALPALTESITQLLKATVIDILQRSKSPSSAERTYDSIRAIVAKRLADPELSIESISTITGYSKRYLHLIFREQGNGETLSNYIQRRRLSQCYQELSQPEYQHKSIGQIAYSWGFSSQAHFSRAFTSVYRVSPRVLRKSKLKEPSATHSTG